MDFFKKLQDLFKSNDFNTISTTVITTIGAINTDNFIQVVYVLIAVISTILQLYNTYKRNKTENKLLELDVELKIQEVLTKQIENDKLKNL